MTPQEPTDEERKAPPPAPSGCGRSLLHNLRQAKSRSSAASAEACRSRREAVAGAPRKPGLPVTKAVGRRSRLPTRKSSRPPKKSVRPRPFTTIQGGEPRRGSRPFAAPITALEDVTSIASTFESLLGDLDDSLRGHRRERRPGRAPGPRAHRERSRRRARRSSRSSPRITCEASATS